jgi:hypothetical protein
MSQSLEVFAVLANIEHGNEKNTILETLGKEIDDFYVYKFFPEEGQYYASINWKGIIGHLADLTGIAAFIWTIYEATVKPEIENPTRNTTPSVIIQINDKSNNYEIFNINGNYESKEIFIQEFTKKVEILRHQNTPNEDIYEIYEKSERWIRIK